MTLSEHQQIARDHPCFEAEECADPRFGWRANPPIDFVTIILTVNIGLE